MKIGDLARLTGCPVESIRYYEREGLLPAPSRSQSNYRQYEQLHLERLLFIRHCRSLDMAQEEIRGLLQLRDSPQADCGAANQLIDQHLHHVEVRIRELQSLRQQLAELRERCNGRGPSETCGILQDLQMPATPSVIPDSCADAGHLHVPGVKH